MRVIIQRVSRASVTVEGKIIGKIGQGLMLLVGFGQNDEEIVLKPTIDKICNMRIFSNPAGRFDFSLLDINGGVLLVPQFTLFADTSKGRRPEFFGAMEPKKAKEFFEKFVTEFKKALSLVEAGEFGADMKVELVNDGPVTISIEI